MSGWRRRALLIPLLPLLLQASAAVAGGSTAPDPIERGRYVAILGDCLACHTNGKDPAFAGARPLNTPFGVVYSANITPDRDTGIGAWTADQFYRALHSGRDAGGHYLYPAFPYPYFTRIDRADSDALFAYLHSLPPVHLATPRNRLPFPLNLRFLLRFWDWMYLDAREFQPDAARSAEWNRGAYLVIGPGHCGACHTPKNWAGADRARQPLAGYTLDNWYAADLTGSPRAGLAQWSVDDIVEYLHSGRNQRATASGAMQEVVAASTSQMHADDLRAIAVYLKERPAARADAPSARPATDSLLAGEAIFTDECSACHRMRAQGVPGEFPPLSGDASLQSPDPTTVIRIVLEGSRSQPTAARPTPLTMPAFAWKLNDQQVADVLNFLRNSFGNQAEPVADEAVQRLRRQFGPAGN
jgi:mono/diheme cytochrome c family protein